MTATTALHDATSYLAQPEHERLANLERFTNFEIMVRRGIGGTCLQSDARQDAKLCVANNTPPCEAQQDETRQEAVWTTTQRPGVRVHRDEPFQRTTEGW